MVSYTIADGPLIELVGLIFADMMDWFRVGGVDGWAGDDISVKDLVRPEIEEYLMAFVAPVFAMVTADACGILAQNCSLDKSLWSKYPRSMKIALALTIILSIATDVLYSQTRWEATAGNISFTIKNRGSTVSGHFTGFSTALVFSPDKLSSSSLKGYVDVNTINTNNQRRDKDLKDDTYFDLSNHKSIEVISAKLTRQGSQFLGYFNVNIKGVTRSVQIPFQFTGNGNTAEFKANFTINRRDFGVGSKSGLAFFLSDDVHVSITIRAKKS